MTTEQNKQWQVLNHDYVNTGGNSMASIITVWLPQQNRTLFAVCGDEGCSLNTVDFITNEVDYDEDMLVAACSFDGLVANDIWLDLWTYCRFEYIKEDCFYFGHSVLMAAGELPQYLLDQVPVGYAEWLDSNGQLIETDGHKIFVESGWQAIMVDDDPIIKEAEEFLQHLETCCDDPQDDATRVTITVHGKTFTAYDHAALIQGLIDAVQCFIDEQ